MEKCQELRPVELKDGILWLEGMPGDFVEDCLSFSRKDTVLVQDKRHKLLVFSNEEKCETAEFRDLNKKEKTKGIEFDIIYYESTECTKGCNFRDTSFPVSFIVQCNSKRYQMSCSKSKSIEFLEQNTSDEETVDGNKRNIIFYRNYLGQFSMFESDFARDYWLCTEFENGLYKLALKKVTTSGDIDEETHLELSPSLGKKNTSRSRQASLPKTS
ncbi:uncharacterized protein LOC121269483 isoform X2 [Carcharodon carcharias]|uniref:uncharacterized protein LOC121269483 isoform X2 n=1 Tax=Carcharodon carcharias TaxID=13397 RepID=UPI001B7E6A61|nr:uncharacterized protein LOC121269483 isoform X2 [Carcharodon carcharias]